MVYVKKAVDLDGRVTNVLKVLNNAYNIVMFYSASSLNQQSAETMSLHSDTLL
jgi:hypothetical protein